MEKKRVYIPSINELKEMQSLLKSPKTIYKYCLAKKIEYIVANGGLEYFNEEEKNNRDVVSGVINFIPSDIWCTPFNEDINLASQVLFTKKSANKEYGLDYLGLISPKLLNDDIFTSRLLLQLSEILKTDPRYRFTYISSKFLDTLFEKKLFTTYKKDIFYTLIEIEPSYILEIDESQITSYEGLLDVTLSLSITEYTRRMGVAVKEYDNIIKPKHPKTKKLVKFLMDHKEF